MTVHEKVLRTSGFGFASCSVGAVPAWFVSLPLAIVLTVLASTGLLIVSLWYLGWLIDGGGSHGEYAAAYLGAGGANSIYMCKPYLVWGRRFRRRIMLRRLRDLEQATGFDSHSPFTSEPT